MAKKTGKAVKDLAEEVKKLRKENGKLAKSLEKVRQDGAESRREILVAIKDGLKAREKAGTTETTGAQQADGGTNGKADREAEETPEAATNDGQESEEKPEPEVTDAAKRRAKELGVDPTNVRGTGSDGRVLVKDVEAAAG